MGFWDDLGRSLSQSMELDHQRKMMELQQIGVALQFARNKYNFGEFQAALAAYEQALAMAQINGSPELQATILTEMGNTYKKTNQLDRALQAYNQGLEVARKYEDLARLHNQIGVLYDASGEAQKAFESYQKALSINLGNKQRGLKRTILRNAGLSSEELGNYQQARNYLTETLNLAQKLGDKDSQNELKDFIERLPE